MGLVRVLRQSEDEIDDLAEDQLERFPVLVVLAMDKLIEAGFQIVPTFRTPHVMIAFDGDLHGLAHVQPLRGSINSNRHLLANHRIAS
jgi:hypothetical protein